MHSSALSDRHQFASLAHQVVKIHRKTRPTHLQHQHLTDNSMESTNPNAHMHPKTNGQTLFETLVGHSCRRHSCGTFTLVEHYCRDCRVAQSTQSCGTLVTRKALVAHSSCDTLVGHSLLSDTLVGHYARKLLTETLVGDCATLL